MRKGKRNDRLSGRGEKIIRAMTGKNFVPSARIPIISAGEKAVAEGHVWGKGRGLVEDQCLLQTAMTTRIQARGGKKVLDRASWGLYAFLRA